MANIGLIVGDSAIPTAGDSALQTVISAEHSVTMHSDTDVEPVGLDGFVLSESCTIADLEPKYIGTSVPMLVLEVGYWNELLMTNAANNNTGTQSQIVIAQHDITNGVSIPLANAGSMFGPVVSTIAPGGHTFIRNDTLTHGLGFWWDAGDALWNSVANARLVGISIINNAADDLTASGELIILNAINWMLLPPVVASPFQSVISVPRLLASNRRR